MEIRDEAGNLLETPIAIVRHALDRVVHDPCRNLFACREAYHHDATRAADAVHRISSAMEAQHATRHAVPRAA